MFWGHPVVDRLVEHQLTVSENLMRVWNKAWIIGSIRKSGEKKTKAELNKAKLDKTLTDKLSDVNMIFWL